MFSISVTNANRAFLATFQFENLPFVIRNYLTFKIFYAITLHTRLSTTSFIRKIHFDYDEPLVLFSTGGIACNYHIFSLGYNPNH